jgi:hypothetical protein
MSKYVEVDENFSDVLVDRGLAQRTRKKLRITYLTVLIEVKFVS